jgi:hypothetical protein
MQPRSLGGMGSGSVRPSGKRATFGGIFGEYPEDKLIIYYRYSLRF